MTEPIAYVPVFPRHLGQVLELLAKLIAQQDLTPDEDDAGSSPAPSAIGSVEAVLWNQSGLVELFRRCKAMQRVIVTCIATASKKGESASYEAIRVAMEQAAGQPVTFERVRGNFSWVSKYAAIITGTPEPPYAFTDHGAQHERGVRYSWKMEKSDAEAWLAIVASAR